MTRHDRENVDSLNLPDPEEYVVSYILEDGREVNEEILDINHM